MGRTQALYVAAIAYDYVHNPALINCVVLHTQEAIGIDSSMLCVPCIYLFCKLLASSMARTHSPLFEL